MWSVILICTKETIDHNNDQNHLIVYIKGDS